MSVTLRPKGAPQPATTTHQAPAEAPRTPNSPGATPASRTASTAEARAPTATAQSASEARARSTASGDVAQGAVLSRMAVATPAMAPAAQSMNTRYKLPEQRTQLLLNSPQVDRVGATTHDDVRCGGAAAANALIMDSRDPKMAAANAQAVRQLARDRGVTLTRAQQDAVDALEKGAMTPTNSAHLQEALFSIGQASGGGQPGSGLSVDQMSNLVAGLRERGGLANSSPTFHLNRTPAPHWTLTTGDGQGNLVHVNTQKRAGTEYAQVTSGNPTELGPGGEDGTGNPGWGGTVSLNNYGEKPSLRVDIPTQNGRGELMLDSPNYYGTDYELDPAHPSPCLPSRGATTYRRSDNEPLNGD